MDSEELGFLLQATAQLPSSSGIALGNWLCPLWQPCYASVKASQASINALAVQKLEGSRVLIVCVSSDDCVWVWSNQEDGPDDWIGQASWTLQQSLTMPLRLQQAVATSALPEQPNWCLIWLHDHSYLIHKVLHATSCLPVLSSNMKALCSTRKLLELEQ